MPDPSHDTPDETPDDTPEEAAPPRTAGWAERRDAWRTGRLARDATAFARRHGGADATISYLGARGARIVLVAPDGAWGDLVAPTYAMAREAVARAGLTVHEDFDSALAAKVRTGPYEWSRMAGIQLGGRSRT